MSSEGFALPIANQDESVILLSENKRARSQTAEVESPQSKKAKTTSSNGDKKSRKRRRRKRPVVEYTSGATTSNSRRSATAPPALKMVQLGESSTTQNDLGEGPSRISMSPIVRTRSMPTANISAGIATDENTTKEADSRQQCPDVLQSVAGVSMATGDNIPSEQPLPTRIDKGKSRALESTPIDQGERFSSNSLSQTLSLDQQAPLRSPDSHALEQHKNTLSSLSQSLYCQICLDILFKPYALAPCGHVTCYDCLIRWFNSPGEGEGERHPPRPVWRRKKTCPHCRAEVVERPAEVWIIKDMVNTLAQSGLVPGFDRRAVEQQAPPPTRENAAVAGEQAPVVLPDHADAARQAPANADPWDNIFSQARGRYGAAAGQRERDMGIFDEEDDVWRCYDCMHEIFDGECTGCERPYPAHIGVDGDDDNDFNAFAPPEGWMEFDDEDEDDEAQLLRELDEDDVDDYMEQYGRGVLRPGPNADQLWYAEYGGGSHGSTIDSSDIEDDSGDSDVQVRLPGPHRAPQQRGRQPAPLTREEARRAQIQAANDSEGDGDDLDEEEERSEDEASQYGGSFIDDEDDHHAAPHEAEINVAAESEDEENIRQPARAGRNYRLNVVDVDTEDEDDGNDDSDNGQIVQAGRQNLRGRGRPSAPIVLSSDSEHDQEEEDGSEDDGEDNAEDSDLANDDLIVDDEEDEDGSIRRPPMRLVRDMARRYR